MSSSKTRTTHADLANPLPPPTDELAALRQSHDTDTAAAGALLDQLHEAHRGLTALAKRLRTAEHRHESEVAKAAAALAAGKAEAETEAEHLAAERARLAGVVEQAAGGLRALAAAAAAVADPLLPHAEGDDAGPWDVRRDPVLHLAERQPATEPDALAAGFTAVKGLVDVIGARVQIQGNRVSLLRAHVDELQAEAARREEDAAALKRSYDGTQSELAQVRGELDGTRRTCSELGEDLEVHKLKLNRTTTSSLEKEAQLLRERERLEADLAAARGRADEAGARVRDLTGLLRKAERCGADLVRVLVDLAEADLEAPAADRLPALAPARDELAELGRDAANAMDDEIDGLFRQDLGEDLVAAARVAADALVARRKALAGLLADAENRAAEAGRTVTAQRADLDRLESERRADSGARERLDAQLVATRAELDARAAELAERNREVTALKAELARAGAQAAELTARLEQAKSVQVQLDRTDGELAAAREQLAQEQARFTQLAGLQTQLARRLVEVATAADSGIAVAGLKADGSVSRLTRTVHRLEGETGRAEPFAAAKAAIEVADKLTGRLAQLGAELTRRGNELESARKALDERERALSEQAKAAAAAEDRVRALTEEVADLTAQARRGAIAAERLAARETELAAAQAELIRLREQARQAAAAVEELRARSEDVAAAQARDVADLRRRLADEQKSRRAAEAAAAERLEAAEGDLALAKAKAEQLAAAVEERDERLAVQRAAQDEAAQARARAAELSGRVETQTRDLTAAAERLRRLEAELEHRPVGASSEDLTAARAERDAAVARLRGLERKLADETAAAASQRSQAEALRRKLDERDAAHRAEVAALQERHDAASDEARRLKEKLAGLQAKVRTLTAV